MTFDEDKETFQYSYDKLIDKMNEMLIINWERIKNGEISPAVQSGGGTKHTMKEFEALRERYPFAWTDVIGEWKKDNI